MKLKNKNIFITGAAGGIGSSLCRLFCERGAHVHALDLNQESLSNLKQELACDDHKISTHILDVTSKSDFKSLTRTTKQQSIDIWINNAGISFPQAFADSDEDVFDKIIDVNLKGVIYGTRFALNQMNAGKDKLIINIASVAGHVPVPFLSSYTTSKFGVVGFTQSLQMELSQQQSPIKIMLVSPGFADTAIMKSNPNEFSVPKSLSWMISTPHKVAFEIVTAIEKNRTEVYPVPSGRALMAIYKYAPTTVFSFLTRLVSAKNIKQVLGMQAIRKSKI